MKWGLFSLISAVFASKNAKLLKAVQDGNFSAVQTLLAEGVEVNAKSVTAGGTPLIAAAQNGNIEIVKLLLQKGADFNAKDENGATALTIALQKGHMEIFELLQDIDTNILFEELKTIGRYTGFLTGICGGAFDERCRNIRAIQIGDILNERGGFALMQRSAYEIRNSVGVAASEELSCVWNGIGAWKW